MPTMPDTDRAKLYLPDVDGLYFTTLDSGTRRGRQWISRMLAIGCNDLIPDWVPDDRFYYPSVRHLILTWNTGHTAQTGGQPKLEGNGYFSRHDLYIIGKLVGWDDGKEHAGPPDPNAKTTLNLTTRVQGCIDWQAFLVRHYMARYHLLRFGWYPARLLSHSPSMNRTCFTTENAWQRVNRKLRDDPSLKDRVESDDAVRNAANLMDDIIDAWIDQQGQIAVYEATTVDGERFPVPKRWWQGYLASRKRVSDVDYFPGAVLHQRYDAAFRKAASQFRQAVGTVITSVTSDADEEEDGPP